MAMNLVLWEPEIPQNTGNIARTCAATGSHLHLIEPMGFKVTDRNLKRAGMDYWYNLKVFYYNNLDHFFELNPTALCFYCTTKAPRGYTQVQYPPDSFLVFGKESAGLPEALLKNNPQQCVRIPMTPNNRSLNLSNAAAIMVYEALRQQDFPGMQDQGQLTTGNWS